MRSGCLPSHVVGCVLPLFILVVSPTFGQGDPQQVVVQKTNGTGIYCRGCAAAVTVIHEELIATQHRWKEPGFKILARDVLTAHCEGSADRGDEDRIARACKHFIFYSGVIGSRHFGGSTPTEDNLYSRISRVCIDELGICYAPEDPPSALASSSAAKAKGSQRKEKDRSRCAAVAAIVHDMYDAFTSLDTSHASFRPKTHARAVIETACAHLVRRFPGGPALGVLSERCFALVDEYEDELVDALASSAAASGGAADSLSGEELEAIGAFTRCEQLPSIAPWRSPWATRKAVGAASEAVEAGETEASELVKRLLSYPKEKLLPIEKDPEGLAGAATLQDGAGASAGASDAAPKKRRRKNTKRKGKEEL